MHLSRSELKRFEDIADNSPVTMLVVADDPPRYTIAFASNMQLLGYANKEVWGLPMAELLPPKIRKAHPGLMQSFKEKVKQEGLEGKPQGMAGGRVISGYTKAGELKPIVISITYRSKGLRGFFLGFMQPEGEVYYDVEKLYNLRTNAERIVDSVKSDLRKRIEKAGGVGLFATSVVLPMFTNVLPAIRNAGVSAWTTLTSKAPTDNPASLTVTAEISEKQRKLKLLQVRNDISNSTDPELIAVAYYEFEEKLNGIRATWIADTQDRSGRDVWFFDSNSTDNPLRFGLMESELLTQHECVLKEGAAMLPANPKQTRFTVIFCPTFELDEKNGILRVKPKGLIAGAYPSTVKFLEPHATILWEVGPSLETVTGQ